MRAWRSIGLLALYVGAQIVALLLAVPFRSAGLSEGGNPTSVGGPLAIVAVIVLAPLAILFLARRRGGLWAVRQLILLSIAGALYVTLFALFSLVLPGPILLPPTGGGLALDFALPLAASASVAIYLALLIDPQWYVVDLVGFLAAGSLIALLGISFAILPVFVLLIALAVYDAIAVYRTRHMLRLADVVSDLKLPILMVMPNTAGFDYSAARTFSAERQQPVEEREAMFMGLGDVVIPGILIVSAFAWLPTAPAVAGVGGNLWVAIGALVGSLVGYAVLMRFVLRGNAQAGLPFLNTGAILGYLAAFLVVYRSFGFGLTGSL